MIDDKLQREQALDPTQSFIVQAPAGSGKTELLTQRFLRLLACVHEPEEILAVTFTKKAASEMRGRISAALQNAQHKPRPETAHEQKTWGLAKQALAQDQKRNWGLLTNPNRLRVKTIDAFNSLLTQQLPLLSHFGAQPEIIDQPQILYSEAVKTLLGDLEENMEWSKAIACLLSHLDTNINNTEKLLIKMLERRDQWLPYIIAHQSHPSLRKMLENNINAVILITLDEIRNSFPKEAISELLVLAQFAAGNLKINNPHSSILHCASLHDLPGTSAKDIPAWRGLAELLMTQDHQWRKRITVNIGFPPTAKPFKKRLEDLIAALCDNDRLTQSLADLHYLPDSAYSEPQWKILEALHDVLKILAAQLAVTFKLHGKIDYTENALAALLSLGNEDSPTDLALVMDYQIKHIVVDEFQDTSNNQFRLLEKLVHGWQPDDLRTLFLVGDPMQSIYRFREAEVGLFLRARQEGIGPVSLMPLTLSVNFRSTASIVHWINTHFDRILPPFDDLANGAVSYTPSKAQHPDDQPGKAVTIHAVADAHRESQADAVVQILQQTLAASPQDTIAVLVRSRSHVEAIMPALRTAKLDFQAIDIDPLDTRPLIQDLLALTRALLYPADRISWLSILRAPWCGLSLSDLLLLAGDSKQALWQPLQETERLASLSADGQSRLKRVLPVLQIAISERRREELQVWVENTWLLLGGPACLDNKDELKDAAIFFDLLKRIARDGASLNSGLRWQVLEESISKLFAQTHTAGQIQIMTIHNAKGLEFDTVILPHLEKGALSDEKPLLLWQERPLRTKETVLLLAPIHAANEDPDPIYTYIRRQESLKTKHENGRLLYVAATRAKKALHLVMSLKTNTTGEVTHPTDNSMLSNLWPAIRHELHYTTAPQSTPQQNATPSRGIKRLTGSWINPHTGLPPERPAHNKMQGFHLTENTAQALGLVVHRIFQELARRGLSWWQQKSLEQQNICIQNLLLQEGILSTLLEETSEKTRRAIDNCLTDSRGRWILEQPEGESEFALTAMIKQQPTTLIIDRTFIDENNIRWIIDYKTAIPRQEQSLEQFFTQETAKYQEKMTSYQQAMQALETRTIRLGLYFPLVPAWCEI